MNNIYPIIVSFIVAGLNPAALILSDSRERPRTLKRERTLDQAALPEIHYAFGADDRADTVTIGAVLG